MLVPVKGAYSPYRLPCNGLNGPLLQPTSRVFRRLFRDYELSEQSRSDKGLLRFLCPRRDFLSQRLAVAA